MEFRVVSQNGKAAKKFSNQKELVCEFMKVLSLAHECVPESVTKSDGTKITFFQGPSPDEVTLVDFAKFQGFEFKETSDTKVAMQRPR